MDQSQALEVFVDAGLVMDKIIVLPQTYQHSRLLLLKTNCWTAIICPGFKSSSSLNISHLNIPDQRFIFPKSPSILVPVTLEQKITAAYVVALVKYFLR